MTISPLKISKVFAIALLVLAIALANASLAEANGLLGKAKCKSVPDTKWKGDGGSNLTGTCTHAANSNFALFHCGADTIKIDVYVDGSITSIFCGSVPSSPSSATSSTTTSPGPAQLGKCKLLSIDSMLHIGTNFDSSWIGKLDSIRFRRNMAGTVFVPPLAGTFHFEDGHRAGEFFTFGLDRGRWEATCWGSDGTFGTAFVVFVQ